MIEKKTTSWLSIKWAGLLLGSLLLLLIFCCSIVYGATPTGWDDAISSIVRYDESVNEQIVVRTTRIPRALMAASIGASLAVAGSVMQAVTRNPLASPSILGINGGASFAVVFAITVLHVGQQGALVWISFAGAAFGAASVYTMGAMGRGGLSPLKIVMAGAAMSALFMSFTQGLLAGNESGLQDVLFWLAGSVAGRPIELLTAVIPYMTAGWLGSLLLARHLNILASGEETAKGLGQRTTAVKLAAGAIVVLLAGSAVAVAGPIGFIGIVIPCIARFFAGTDYRWSIPYCAILGAALLLSADLAARFIIMPEEVPVGVMTAVIGTPFFIYIARKGGVKA
ncbi:FecCD family ABC transporter permease [Cohnella faecalis]|uniref:Iron ABC transporter permease n=1 Tax=Cohnella faecalis TaxID=2315694 RepID=A0A398CQM8_9BACL|nr:iron ABC transporter permease [Cohnella faecalis]RIE04843.1 iron ABC transporter permease [Cohnella faecalis]